MSNVYSPIHYSKQPFQPIEIMEKMNSVLLANAFKYVWRAEYKGKEKEDWEKAKWYVERFEDFIDNPENEKFYLVKKIDNSYEEYEKIVNLLKICNFSFHKYEALKQLVKLDFFLNYLFKARKEEIGYILEIIDGKINGNL